jgi:hypothetical protein
VDNDRKELRRARTWSAKLREETDASATPTDPEARQLRDQSAEFNARVHQALAEIPVPPTLREQILARTKIIPVDTWRRPKQLLAIAAGIVLLGALSILWLRPHPEDLTFAGFQSRMVGFALRQYSMDIHTNQLAAVQTFLAQKGAPAQFILPPALATRPVVGGARLSWQDRPVGMVCFAAPDGNILYMFVIDSAHLPAHSPDANLSAKKPVATATWQSNGKTFLIAGQVPPEDLQKLVKS